MTPVYMNPGPSSGSFPKEDHHLQFFLSPPNHHLSSSSTSSTSFVTTARDPRASVLLLGEPKQHQDPPPKGLQFYGKSSGDYQHPISSPPFQPAVNGAKNDGHKFESSEIQSEDWEGSCGVKWMPSKMRLMQKIMSSTGSSTKAKADDDDDDKPMKFTLKLQDQRYHVNEISTSSFSSNQTHNSATVIRVCSDCNTTTTPLWRSGPRGPKSLCNACGIRQRKARRAAAAADAVAGNGIVEASPSSKTNHKLQAHKEKKLRSSHNIGQSKKSCNKPPQNTKFCFEKITLSLSTNSAFQGAFSRDVEEAAILLMELSCGFIQS